MNLRAQLRPANARTLVLAVACGVSLALSCGPTPDPVAPKPVASSAVAVASAPLTTSPSTQAPATLWDALSSMPAEAVWVNGKRVRTSAFAPFIKQAITVFDRRQTLAGLDKKCGFPLLDSIDELLITADAEGEPAIVVLRGVGSADLWLGCVAFLDSDASRVQIEGYPGLALGSGDAIAVSVEGLLIMGLKPLRWRRWRM